MFLNIISQFYLDFIRKRLTFATMLLIIVFLIIVAITFYLYRTKHVNYWEKKGIPLAGGWNWFFGHYKPVLFNEKHIGLVFDEMYNDHPNDPFVGYLKMSKPGLLVRDPDVIKAIMTTEFNHFHKNEITVDKNVDFLFGNNPFVQYGEPWKWARAHVSPLLTLTKLNNYLPAMLRVADEMVNYVDERCRGKGYVQLEGRNLASMYTTDVIANAIFGIENNTFVDEDSLVAQLTREIFRSDVIDNVRVMIALAFPELNSILRIRFATKRCERVLVSLTQKMMKEREASGETRTDIFQQMLAYRRAGRADIYTDEYIASQLYGFVLDGSSIVMCYAIFELSWHTEVQDKLRTEINEMITKTNGDFSVEDIERLRYLDMVINETLRLHVPVLVLLKECTSDYTFIDIPGLKRPFTVEKGTSLAIPIYSIHRDEKYYSSPERFLPSRFSEDEVAKRHNFVHLPFGEGPRKCIGQRFALLQTKVAIIKLIQKFRLTPSSKSNYSLEIDPKVFMLMRPLNGAWVQMQPIYRNQ